MKKRTRIMLGLVIIFPLILGTIGFMNAGLALNDAVFTAINLYLLEYGDPTPNMLVEIARWMAPVMTASGIISALKYFSVFILNKLRYIRGNSIAIYGAGSDAMKLKKELKNRLVTSEDGEYVMAHRYVLFGSEMSNLEFYSDNRERLKHVPVCIKCSAIKGQDIIGDRITVFNPEEIAARLFWRNSDIFEHARSKEYKLNISIIGAGALGEAVLIKGLQDNIFAPNQDFVYHMFGNSEGIRSKYLGLDNLEDRIEFYESWGAHIGILQASDLIIIADQENLIDQLRSVLFATSGIKVYVLSSIGEVLELFDDNTRLEVFDWDKDILKEEYLFHDELLNLAKRINLRYAHIYGNIDENEENFDNEWRKLNSFTRYSNISAADYHEIRLKMMKKLGISTSVTEISDAEMELLAELEHIRWCRYHYLSNWKYGIPENGNAKDPVKRIHSDLIPYTELPESEKEKDRENISILLSL